MRKYSRLLAGVAANLNTESSNVIRKAERFLFLDGKGKESCTITESEELRALTEWFNNRWDT